MKFIILGIILILLAVGIAGNWIYIPISLQAIEEDYRPIAHFPDGDEADGVFHSNLTYISSLDMHYIEWNYVWLNVSGHTPDTEEIRIYVKNGSVHHVSLRIHYEWMDTTDFEAEGNRVHIYFISIYHTPYTTPTSLISMTVMRTLPIAIPLLLGIGLIIYGIKHRAKKIIK